MGGRKAEKNPQFKIIAKHKIKSFQMVKEEEYWVMFLVCLNLSVLFTVFTVFYIGFGLCSSPCIYRAPNTGFSSAPVFR